MKKAVLALLTGFAVLAVQSGSVLAEIRCETKATSCCCTPHSQAPQKNSPCPMMTQAVPQLVAVVPSKISVHPASIFVSFLVPERNPILVSFQRISFETDLAPPGPSSHLLPSLRAPPALA